MTDLQDSKALILCFYDELDKATGDKINDVLRSYTANEYHWCGMHPFYEQYSADAVADVFWKPFHSAFNPVQRHRVNICHPPHWHEVGKEKATARKLSFSGYLEVLIYRDSLHNESGE